MRRLVVFCILLLFIGYINAQVVENPVFDRADFPAFRVQKVEIKKDTTHVYCSYSAEAGSWASISKETSLYIRKTNKKYPLLRCDVSPQQKLFKFAERCNVLLCFPSIRNLSKFDLIVNESDKAFNIYGIDISNTYQTSYQESDVARFSNMASFYDSAGDTIKALQFKIKEIEATKYVFGVKSEPLIVSLLNASIIYDKYGYSEQVIDINQNIDTLSAFTDKYYNEIHKDPVKYYLIQRKIYQYYYDKHDWRKSIKSMTQVENATSQDISTIDLAAYSRFDIGGAYIGMKDFISAEKWCLSSFKAFSSISNRENDETYGCLLLLLSKIYFEHLRNLKKSYEFSLEAERVNKKLFGETSKMHIVSLDFLAYSELALGKNQIGVEHLERMETLLNNTYDLDESEKQGYYDKLKLAYLRLNINKNIASQDTIVSENSLLYEATNAYAQGHMKEAINQFGNLLKIYESNLQSKDIANYVYVIGSLSNVLTSEGYYAQADSLLDNSIATFHDNKIDSPLLRGLYESKGLLYYTINNVDMALYWYNQAKNMYAAEDERTLQYGLLLSNIAGCQVVKENYSLAKQLSEKAYDICVQFYGANSNNANDRLLILNNLATIYTKMKDFSKGKELYERVIEEATSQQNIGAKALALINLSEIYLLYENDFPKAEEYLRESMKMEAASYVKDLAEMDLLFTQILQRRETAINDIEHYNNRIKEELASMYENFSELEREEYWTQKSQSLVFLNNLSALTFNTPHALKMAYENALFTKSMLINSGRLLGQLINNCSSGIQNEYSSMIYMKRRLSGKNCPNDSIDVYREVISHKEKAIVDSIPNFGSQLMAQFKTCGDVQRMLSDNDIAIEFIFLPQIKSPFDKSELSYGAMILAKSDTIPKLIPLCSEYVLEDLMDAYTPMGQNGIDSLYAFSNKTLYHMIWEKLELYIPVGSTVYYSPTGYISKINLSAISNGKKRLSEIYGFHEVSTTALIDEV